jgi:Phosphotransferase enzyme family
VKPDAVERAERLLGVEATAWSRVIRRGYSQNEHWTIVLADGGRAFVKEAHVDPSPEWVRDEHRVYQAVSGPFMPAFLGFEDGEHPLLVLEDLMPGGRWPPPWREGDIDAVRASLAEVAAADVRGELPRLVDVRWPGWEDVEAEPGPFLSLGLVSPAWLEDALPVLVEAARATSLDGEALLHCDVRSDNLCLRDGRAVLVDWNHARLGNPALDVAFWLPSLALEGGPPPSLFGVDEMAVVVAGFFAALAGLPQPLGAPTVRAFQKAQLEVALPWACSSVGLPLPG